MTPTTNPKAIFILGLSAFYHDSAACLVKDGTIIAAAQEERFTRLKHDASFPTQAVAYCLQEGGIAMGDVSFVGFYEKPFIKFERLLTTYLQFAPLGLRSFLQAMPLWLGSKLFLKDLIRKELAFDGNILFCEHHESHAASAFFPSPFEAAAILTMDGVGEWTTTSYGTGDGNRLTLKADIRFPHSLGLLYSAFTYYTGFRVNSGEYKLMGLAPYGEPRFVKEIRDHLIDIKEDGSFRLNMEYFDYCAGFKMTNEKFDKLFGGEPRKPESAITQKDMDLARSIQDVTEDVMLKMAGHVQRETGLDNLCLAGGVALNCVGNGKLLKESKFKNIWVQPAAGDAGSALGVALLIWHHYLNKERVPDKKSDTQEGSLLGPLYSNEHIEETLRQIGASYDKLNEKELVEKVAHLVKDQNVIGLFQGRMEFGPRALGNRSIIADARSEAMQSKLNLKIKFRESFRPFAPSVLEGKTQEYFDLNCASPYMMLVADVAKDKLIHGGSQPKGAGLEQLKVKRSVIPAVTHVDNSARIQTVSEKTNGRYYHIIKRFEELTGCPVIINTSFNIRGEPIVCTPQDAYRCFMCTDMDYLVLGNCLMSKERQPNKDKFKKEQISVVLD